MISSSTNNRFNPIINISVKLENPPRMEISPIRGGFAKQTAPDTQLAFGILSLTRK